MAGARITPVMDLIPEEYQGPRVGNTGVISQPQVSSGPHSPNFRYTENLGMGGSKFGAAVTLAGSINHHSLNSNGNGQIFNGNTSQILLPIALDSNQISPDAGPKHLNFHESRLQDNSQLILARDQPINFIQNGATSARSFQSQSETLIYIQEGTKKRVSDMAAQPIPGQDINSFYNSPSINVPNDPFTNEVRKTNPAFFIPRAKESLFPTNASLNKRHEIFNSTEMSQPLPTYPLQHQRYSINQNQQLHDISTINNSHITSPQFGFPKQRVLGPKNNDSVYPHQAYLNTSISGPEYNPLAQMVSVVQPVPGYDLNHTIQNYTGDSRKSHNSPPEPWVVNQVTPMEMISEPVQQGRPSLEYTLNDKGPAIQGNPNYLTPTWSMPNYQMPQNQPISLARTIVDVPQVDVSIDAQKPGQQVSTASNSLNTSDQLPTFSRVASNKNNLIAKEIFSDLMKSHSSRPSYTQYAIVPENTQYLRSYDEPSPIIIDINDVGNHSHSRVVRIFKEPNKVAGPTIVNEPSRYRSEQLITPSRASSINKVNLGVYSNFFSGSEQAIQAVNQQPRQVTNQPNSSTNSRNSPLTTTFGAYKPISATINQQTSSESSAAINNDPFYHSPRVSVQPQQNKGQFLTVPGAHSNVQTTSDPNSRLPNPNTGQQALRN